MVFRSKRSTSFVLLSLISTTCCGALALNPTKIQVCQNKGCVKSFPSKYDGGLVQTLKDLIPSTGTGIPVGENDNSVIIEASDCLSQCSNGPNVCCSGAANEERVFGKVDGIQMAAAVLEVGADVDSPGVLMAAIEDMAMACQSSNTGKKLKLLNRAIQSLQDVELVQTTAMAHALILRADVNIDSIPQNIEQSLKDAMQAAEIDDLNGRAWRVVADAKEANGDVPGAIEAISNWAMKNPSFAGKAKKELERLSSGGSSI